jgi:hypothetical protein
VVVVAAAQFCRDCGCRASRHAFQLALSGTLMCRLCELPVLPVESVVGAVGQAAAALRAVGRGRHAAPPAHQGVLKWSRSGPVTVKSHG